MVVTFVTFVTLFTTVALWMLLNTTLSGGGATRRGGSTQRATGTKNGTGSTYASATNEGPTRITKSGGGGGTK